MSDKDIKQLFGSESVKAEDKGADGKPVAPKGDTPTEALAILVGEGRKYKTNEEQAKAHIEADDFIEKLKDENEKLRQEAVKGKTLSDVFERIEQSRKQTGDTTTVGQKAITAADIERLVDARLTGRETAKTRDENIGKAEKALAEKYGEKAKEVYLTRGDTVEKRAALNSLAAVDPESFVALFTTTAVVGNPSDSSNKGGDRLNVVTVSGRANDPDCKEFYDSMRKKEPSKFYSSEVQLQMHKKLSANAAKFLGRK